MQVVVNERFLERRARISRLATWGGLAVLLVGFVISLAIEPLTQWLEPQWTMALTWILMIGGISAFNTGRFYNVRWVMRPREDEVLAHGLKGLDHRYRFLNYMPNTPEALHVLVGPAGVFVLHARRQDGEITNRGDKWRRKLGITAILRSFFEGAFGNPTQDALRETGAVRKLLASEFSEEELTQLPFQPLIVFMDPRAKLTVSEPAVPVMTPKELKDFARKLRKESRLSQAQLERIAAAYGLA